MRSAVVLAMRSIFVCVFAAVAAACAAGCACTLTPEEFYKRASDIDGINPFAATCQSAHETGNWTSYLWKHAKNGAGIKADKKWRQAGKPHIAKRSREVVGGKTVHRSSYFRAYSSLSEFLVDYGKKIRRDYPLSSKNSDTMWGFFAMLRKGRHGSWATSPKYFEHMVDKALRLAPKLLGKDWKRKMQEDYRIACARRLLSQHEVKIVRRKLRSAGVDI